MDLRRHASIDRCYFGKGDDTLGEITWYVAPDGAEWFTAPTVFRSLETWDGLPPIAERPGVIPYERGEWSNGRTIPGYTGKDHSCGEPSWYLEGLPSPPPPNPSRNPAGVPQCCLEDHFGAAAWGINTGLNWTTFVSQLFVEQAEFYLSTSNSPFLFWQKQTTPGTLHFVWVVGFFPNVNHVNYSLPGYQRIFTDTNGKFAAAAFIRPNAPSEGTFVPSGGYYKGPLLDTGVNNNSGVFVGTLELRGADQANPLDVLVHAKGVGPNANTPLTPLPINPYELVIATWGGGFPFSPYEWLPSNFLVGAGWTWEITKYLKQWQFNASNPFNAPWINAVFSFTASGPGGQGRAWLGLDTSLAWMAGGQGMAVAAWSCTTSLAWSSSATAATDAAWSCTTSLAWSSSATSSADAAWSCTTSLAWSSSATSSADAAWSCTTSLAWVGSSASAGPSISQHAKTQFTGTSGNLTWGSSTAVGEVQFVAVCTERSSGGAITITPPSGYTVVQEGRNGSSGTPRVGLYVRTAGTSQSSTGNWTVSNAGGTSIIGWSVAGLVAGGTVDQLPAFNSQSGSFSSFATSTTGTTAHAVELVFAVLGYGATGGTMWSYGAISGWTQLDTQTDSGATTSLAVYWRLTAATGTFSATTSNGPSSSPAGCGAIIASYQ
jgi:hypothetical protein